MAMVNSWGPAEKLSSSSSTAKSTSAAPTASVSCSPGEVDAEVWPESPGWLGNDWAGSVTTVDSGSDPGSSDPPHAVSPAASRAATPSRAGRVRWVTAASWEEDGRPRVARPRSTGCSNI
ncbi:hypothetical protein [Blastococcus brunescens]|uniref:hypothetical protein n=1 Tax=Blastococcus brunescens TaxID=1564165 RepID=UPI003BEEC681